jgi:hypothetical protein
MKHIAIVHPSAAVSELSITSEHLGHRALFEELRRLGYIEGQNLVVNRYSGEGQLDRFDDLAREVVHTNPDLIVPKANNLTLRFKAATTTIPIIGVIGYALTNRDISTAENPKRLIITISKGKTGHRISNTMSGAVSVYKRIKDRNPNYSKDDFLFFPTHKNRSNAKRIVQRQFNALFERCKLKHDRHAKTVHTV